MDTYADDLAALVESLDLKDAIHVGHSTGGGEVARYIGRHGTTRVAKAVLVDAVPPVMLKTAANPDGLPIGSSTSIRAGVARRPLAVLRRTSASPFYGANRPGAKVRRAFTIVLAPGMQAGLPPPTIASRRSPRPTSPRT